jgi:hypothetical protein
MSRLPVRATARETYRYMRGHLRLLATPALLLFLADSLFSGLTRHNFGRTGVLTELIPVWQIIGSVIDSAFVVGLYRAVIAGEERGGLAFFRWDRPLWCYALAGLKLGFALIALIMLLLWLSHGYLARLHERPALQFALLVALAVPLVYLVLRMMLALPAAALGEERYARMSWRAMAGNNRRLLALLLLALIPTMIGTAVLVLALAIIVELTGMPPMVKTVSLAGYGAAFETMATVVMTVALALSYRTLAPEVR